MAGWEVFMNDVEQEIPTNYAQALENYEYLLQIQ
jgi:hypothetical protein